MLPGGKCLSTSSKTALPTFVSTFAEYGGLNQITFRALFLRGFCSVGLENEKGYEIKWSILKQAKPYASGTRVCKLCLAEKMAILNAHKGTLLNKRSELVSKCRHENKFYAGNVT